MGTFYIMCYAVLFYSRLCLPPPLCKICLGMRPWVEGQSKCFVGQSTAEPPNMIFCVKNNVIDLHIYGTAYFVLRLGSVSPAPL